MSLTTFSKNILVYKRYCIVFKRSALVNSGNIKNIYLFFMIKANSHLNSEFVSFFGLPWFGNLKPAVLDYFCYWWQCCLLQCTRHLGWTQVLWRRPNEDTPSVQRPRSSWSPSTVSWGSRWRLHSSKWGCLLLQNWRSKSKWADSSFHASHSYD